MPSTIKQMLLLSLFVSNVLNVNGQGVPEKLLTNSKGDDRYASYSPDGKLIVFESDRGGKWDIYLMKPDGKDQEKLTSGDADYRRPSWHPSGKGVLFESINDSITELAEIKLKNRRVKKLQIPPINGEVSFARYSPDGQSIAFTLKQADQKSNIAIMTKKELKVEQLTNFEFRSFYPNWSPNGNKLIFSSRHETNNEDDEIYSLNIDGKDKKRLTHWPKHNFCAAWSTDGKRIAYVTSMRDSRPEIYVMDADGENQVRLTYNNDGETLPSWSIDDKKLLVTCFRNGNYEICELDLENIER